MPRPKPGHWACHRRDRTADTTATPHTPRPRLATVGPPAMHAGTPLTHTWQLPAKERGRGAPRSHDRRLRRPLGSMACPALSRPVPGKAPEPGGGPEPCIALTQSIRQLSSSRTESRRDSGRKGRTNHPGADSTTTSTSGMTSRAVVTARCQCPDGTITTSLRSTAQIPANRRQVDETPIIRLAAISQTLAPQALCA